MLGNVIQYLAAHQLARTGNLGQLSAIGACELLKLLKTPKETQQRLADRIEIIF